jgi:hypothetical protein
MIFPGLVDFRRMSWLEISRDLLDDGHQIRRLHG